MGGALRLQNAIFFLCEGIDNFTEICYDKFIEDDDDCGGFL